MIRSMVDGLFRCAIVKVHDCRSSSMSGFKEDCSSSRKKDKRVSYQGKSNKQRSNISHCKSIKPCIENRAIESRYTGFQ